MRVGSGRREVSRGAVGVAAWLLMASAAAAGGGFPDTRFRALPPLAVEVGPAAGRQALLVADFDGDRLADLATIAPEPDSAEGSVAIYLNRGGGALAYDDSVFVIFGAPAALALADVTSPPDPDNGRRPDGVPDLLIGDSSGTLTVQHGRAGGDFSLTAQVIDVSLAVRGIATGDFDGQPGLDVAVMDHASVYLLCNAAGQLVACGEPIAPGVGDLIELMSGDFDADGATDLALLSGVEKRVVPLYGIGAGRFSIGAPVGAAIESSSEASVDLTVARVDADARDDLVVANRDQFGERLGMVLFGGADRQLRGAAFFLEFDTTALAVADFDAPRGVVEAIGGSAGGALSINPGDGVDFSNTNLFRILLGSQLSSIGVLAVGDLDGDTWPDLVSLDAAGDQVTALLNRNGCAGDCNGDDAVSIDELTRGIGIVLGLRAVGECRALDRDERDGVTIAELIVAVRAALDGCAAPRAITAGGVAERLAR